MFVIFSEDKSIVKIGSMFLFMFKMVELNILFENGGIGFSVFNWI